uniref:Uncharacterized protein n=1 Tax=Panagrolaimus sp. JU765 TaxID=591449 RepID=A0AC34QN53_9BILA
MYEICRINQTVSGCREALLYLRNASHDFESLIGMINVEQSWENDPNQKQQSLAWEVKATSNALKNFRMTPECAETEGSWHVVENRRRKNTNSSGDESADEKNEKEQKKTSIYERLAYNLPRPVRPTSPNEMTLSDSAGTNLMCPRSAMDLPQTKASMAKMAYSRERLWKGQMKPLLEERLQRRQQQTANGTSRRPTYSQVAKGGSSEKSDSDKNRSREPSLASISETAEEDDNLSTVTMAELGQPTTSSNPKSLKNNQPDKQLSFDDIRQSLISANSLMVELEGDDEWKSITAEEESLAQEEESLQKEILEEERSSIDDEFEREANKRFGKTPTRYKKSWKEVVENWSPVPSQTESSNDTMNSHHFKMNSADVVYRKPGEVAQVHEKLSSPSRKRPPSDFEKRLSEKQQKAYELRQKLLEEKAQRLKELHQKVTEVKVRRENVAMKKRNLLSEKMVKACENRERNLAEVVKKAKSDDFRIQEVQLINTLEAMYLKCDMDSKDQMRREKLQVLAEMQEKKKQKQAAKHAQVEENRMAQQMKQQEKLLEKSEKMEARIQNAADQRNQILEETRQKQRKITAKIERLKEEESKSQQILIEKLQNKQTKAEKMHEEGLENVKMKALESVTAREMNGNQMIIRMNELDEEMTERKCLTCRVKILGYHHAIAHICSTAHLANRKLLDKPLTFDFLRNESENVIAELKDKEELRCILAETGIPEFDANVPKKRRSKLWQRLLKENVELKLVPEMVDKNVYKLIKEMEAGMANMAKYKFAIDATRMALEKTFIEMDKIIFVGPDTIDQKLVSKIFSTGILKSALNFLALPFFHEKSVSVCIKRLFMKCSAFIQAVLMLPSISATAFFSDYLTDITELIVVTSQKFLQNPVEYEQAMACLGMLSRFSTDSLNMNFKERLTTLITYLASHDFPEVVKRFFKELHSSSIPDRLQLSANMQICVTNCICSVITFFVFTTGDLKNPKEELDVLMIMFFHFAVNKIRTTFLISDNDTETTHNSPNEEIVIRHLFSALIDSIPKIAQNPSSFGVLRRALLAEDGTVGMHLILLLISVLKEEIKCLSSMKPDPREKIIRLAGYLPLFDPSLGRMCLVGWQSSFLFVLTQQLDFYCPPVAKWNLLASLVSIVRTDQAALEIFQSNIGVSWLLLFLQRLKSGRIKETDDMKIILPKELREEYLKFYEQKWDLE